MSFEIKAVQENEKKRMGSFDELMKEFRIKQEINLKKITTAERNIRENRADLDYLREIKYD